MKYIDEAEYAASDTLLFVYENFRSIFDEQNKGNKVIITYSLKRKKFYWYAIKQEEITHYIDGFNNLIFLEFHPMERPEYYLDDETGWYMEYLENHYPKYIELFKRWSKVAKEFHKEYINEPN